MISGLFGAISTGVSKLKEARAPDTGVNDIHKNRIRNEIEQLKLNQCKLAKCRETQDMQMNGHPAQLCHFHVNNVTMYDRENKKNYVLLDISVVVEDADAFLSNEIPVQVILYRDFPFSPPDITFPTTFCFPSLSDGRSFTAEIVHEWSPSITLLCVVEAVVRFLRSYSSHIAVVGPSDVLIGSYRSPISFSYQCYNSLVYPILGAKVIFEDQTFERTFEKSSCSKGKGAISQRGRSLASSLIPIPLNTRGLRRETMGWRVEKPFIHIDFVFNNTSVMLFDSTLLVLETCQRSQSDGIFRAGNSSKTSSSSDEIVSDSTLQGNVAFWLYLSAVSHIVDSSGKLLFGNQGTLPEYLSDKLSKPDYTECLALVLGYDPLSEKSPISFYQNEELIQIPKDSTRPIVIELKFHTSRANHESSCCQSFATNLSEKVAKLDSNFPQNCHNPKWNPYFEHDCLYNLNIKYQEAILGNDAHLSSEIIQRWVVVCSKLIELSSFISETDESYVHKSSSLVKQMQDTLVCPVVRNILNASAGKTSKISEIGQHAQDDSFFDHLEHYSPETTSNPEPSNTEAQLPEDNPTAKNTSESQDTRLPDETPSTQSDPLSRNPWPSPGAPLEHRQDHSAPQTSTLTQDIQPPHVTPNHQDPPSPREYPPFTAQLISLDDPPATQEHLNTDHLHTTHHDNQTSHSHPLHNKPQDLNPKTHINQNYISLYESSSDEFSIHEFD
ncbi:putative UBC domain-containing protein [Cryptosporidium canis]|uniref:UBC domain-containing protein n=1 Tax=Cryptosporidium canis TaxID=195482 RepID=A0ABQ8P2K4_9CRYT|nr:putative UBC domain-containing protein [Cryptosporidium canis]